MISLIVVLALSAEPAARISTAQPATPSAVKRNDASNFKDMVLTICVSTAYHKQVEASADAAGSARALVEWTRYDAESASPEIEQLVNAHLRRDYRNPLGDAPEHSSRFDFLKCLDLYHSQELERLVRRVVPAHGKAKRK